MPIHIGAILIVVISFVLIVILKFELLGAIILNFALLTLLIDSITTIRKNKKLGWDAEHSLDQLMAQVFVVISAFGLLFFFPYLISLF